VGLSSEVLSWFYKTYAQSEFVSTVLTQIELPEFQPTGIVPSVMTRLPYSDAVNW
jgi:hypothetical protein